MVIEIVSMMAIAKLNMNNEGITFSITKHNIVTKVNEPDNPTTSVDLLLLFSLAEDSFCCKTGRILCCWFFFSLYKRYNTYKLVAMPKSVTATSIRYVKEKLFSLNKLKNNSFLISNLENICARYKVCCFLLM